jgi:bifunctional non-homologous end joining protein LigD
MPCFVQPCLPTLQPNPAAGERWVHEIKHDGYRFQLHVRSATAVAYSRRGHDWSHRVRPIVDACVGLEVTQAILDGEVVVLRDSGVSDYAALLDALGKGRADRLTFYAFHLLYRDGRDLRALPLLERKAALLEVVGDDPAARIRYSKHLETDGSAMLQRACEMGLEGIVSKRVEAPYVRAAHSTGSRSGAASVTRSRLWPL